VGCIFYKLNFNVWVTGAQCRVTVLTLAQCIFIFSVVLIKIEAYLSLAGLRGRHHKSPFSRR
jgi:hypothetical protein